MSTTIEQLSKTFDGLSREMLRDEEFDAGEDLCSPSRAQATYDLAGTRELALQLCRIADSVEIMVRRGGQNELLVAVEDIERDILEQKEAEDAELDVQRLKAEKAAGYLYKCKRQKGAEAPEVDPEDLSSGEVGRAGAGYESKEAFGADQRAKLEAEIQRAREKGIQANQAEGFTHRPLMAIVEAFATLPAKLRIEALFGAVELSVWAHRLAASPVLFDEMLYQISAAESSTKAEQGRGAEASANYREPTPGKWMGLDNCNPTPPGRADGTREPGAE